MLRDHEPGRTVPPACPIVEVHHDRRDALSCHKVECSVFSFALVFLTMAVSNALVALAETPVRRPVPESSFLETNPVCRIQIEIAPKGIEHLRIDHRQYVRAKVRVDGELLRDVGVHLKGSKGSFRRIDDKPSLTLDFDKFVPGQRARGLTKPHLNNSVEDATYLKERLGSELFIVAGIPAPRVGHALVELNGRPLGLCVVKEGFTEDFIARHFERSDGNLYDTEEGHDVNLRMKRQLGSGLGDGQDELTRVASAAFEPDFARRWERLDQSLDLGRFLTFMALEVMICHWDGYALGQNNFRIYHDPAAGKIVFLPAGMDQLFAKPDMPWKPDMAGLVARAIMELPEGRAQYESRFKSLLGTVFVSGYLTNRMDQILAGLRPVLKRDVFRQLRREASELRVRIIERERWLRKELREPLVIQTFEGDRLLLSNGKVDGASAVARMQELTTPDGQPVLRIAAVGDTAASWRTNVRLSPGQYRFQGHVKVSGVARLGFGDNHGAALRFGGQAERSENLIGSADWKVLYLDFSVSAADEEVTLICELRASGGESWFDKGSLKLMRLP